jgi:hypothetical protein
MYVLFYVRKTTKNRMEEVDFYQAKDKRWINCKDLRLNAKIRFAVQTFSREVCIPQFRISVVSGAVPSIGENLCSTSLRFETYLEKSQLKMTQ